MALEAYTDKDRNPSSSPLYFSVEDFCEAENLDKDLLKDVAVDLGRISIRDIAEKHGCHRNTVQKYKNKLSELDRENYIIIMHDIYQEELNRALIKES
jgi:DNA-binding transcriptional regulator YhcF (GntR family)